MSIFAIADLHLQQGLNKPMSIFGDQWIGHEQKLQREWDQHVSEKDLVLIAGDISWAMRHEEVLSHLAWIHERPGKKILIKGNHDYWWQKIGRLNELYPDLYFLQNTAYVEKTLAICGTRGWQVPSSFVCIDQVEKAKENEKIYQREGIRLELSLKDAKKQGAKQMIVMLHYPPTNEFLEDSLFTDLMDQYPISHVVYGHLHDPISWQVCLKGTWKKKEYHLVSADYLNFKLKRIM